MFRFIFKQQQPKRFDFQPRYYNETRQYIEGRKAAIRQELNMENAERGGMGMRSRLQHQWQSEGRQKANKRSNMNVVIIAAILFGLVYLLFFVL